MTLPDQVTSLSLSKKLKELGVPQKSCKEKHLNGQICECFQKEQPKCKYCWDKGFYSVWKGIHGSTDFPGDPNYGKNPYWNNIPCSRCNYQKEQPEQKVHNRLVNMAIGHVRDTAQPSALITQPQELRQEECDCNDIEYCSACIDSPKAPVGWKNCLNKRFRFKRSLDDRHIYYLADDDDDETQYGYLDQFIEVLMMQAEEGKPVQKLTYFEKREIKSVEDFLKAQEEQQKELVHVAPADEAAEEIKTETEEKL